ncbi:MAG: ADP-forming succinate--CoA ligase subunit beta [Pseudomonadota bacterium]|nr:ADP-forming succinate--CoA ligase subunit beta [Pseudomonadota bacterium]
MNIHEYQAKDLLRKFGVSVPRGGVAYTADEAVKVAEELGGPVWVVKSQIHAGGRGKAGGVKLAKSIEEVKKFSGEMIGSNLVTHQTGHEGKEVTRVYVEEGCDIARELYLGILVDRASSRITIMASTEGGMDIEEVAAASPEKILKLSVDPVTGLQAHHSRRIGYGLGLEAGQVGSCIRFLDGMYRAFTELDASVVEINPMVVTGDGDVVALDAKMNFDDNALFRHENIAELRDETEEDPTELEATKYDLNYVKLDGNIGCMVNGAGLAMATMDIIKYYGGEPANFLDVGGGATRDRVTAAFKLILSDPNVEALLVNIFGGIMRCDVIAEGVVAAAREVSLSVPLCVRLAGTNVELGKRILEESGLPIIAADDLADAAEKAVMAAAEAA